MGEKEVGGAHVDRTYWQQRVPSSVLSACDQVVSIVSAAAGAPHSMQYLKKLINVVDTNGTERQVWLMPRKTLFRVGAYVADPEAWLKRFEDIGLPASLRRGKKTTLVSLTPDAFQDHKALLTDFIRAAFVQDEGEPAA